MNVFSRGIGNAFRNPIRSLVTVLILAIAIGLALSMLVAYQAVGDRIAELKSSVGTELTVNPAGSRGFEGGGALLPDSAVATAGQVPGVAKVVPSLGFRLSNSTTSTQTDTGSTAAAPGSTSLQSAVTPPTRSSTATPAPGPPSGQESPRGARIVAITGTGISENATAAGAALNLTAGSGLTDFTANSDEALLGSTLASANNLTVGSTFTAYDRTFTVAGIFDAGNQFGNNGLYIALPAAQQLSGQTGLISSLTVNADNVDNVTAVSSAVSTALGGSSAVDVVTGEQSVSTAVSSLGSVQSISLIGFISAQVTAGVIVLLMMVLVVRERRKEIGVLKAIGSTNRRIGSQFVIESLALTVAGGIVGVAAAFLASGGIAGALISANTTTTAAPAGGAGAAPGGGFAGGGAPPGGGGMRGGVRGFTEGAGQLIGTISTSIGWQTLTIGIVVVLVIGCLGALIPAWLTARIRPLEVLRGE